MDTQYQEMTQYADIFLPDDNPKQAEFQEDKAWCNMWTSSETHSGMV